MTETVRVGTRGSALALVQTELVLRALRPRAPRVRFEAVVIRTQGDRIRSRSSDLDFTDAIDEALEVGRVDLAVHSAKDLPVRTERSVRPVALLRRGDPRDCLILARATGLADLARGARIGSSSARRRAELLRVRPDLEVAEVRGNVDTRLGLVRSGAVDGVILARAGLARLGRLDEVSEVLPASRFVPAPGQGAIAVSARVADRRMVGLLRPLDDPPTRAAVTAERSFVTELGGGCDTPLGAWAALRGGRLTLRAVVLSPDGRRTVWGIRSAPPTRAAALGHALAREVRRAGADELLAQPGRVRGRG